MKWLKILGIVIVVLIVILVSVTIVVENKITDAGERGHSEGHAEGYKVGYQEGRTTGYEKGKDEGYESGYETGFGQGIGTDYLVRHPTYKEVKELLAQYEQDKVPTFERFLFDWAEDLNNYAETKGIRAAYVVISLPDGWIYELVAFETVDKGLIFYDCSWRIEMLLVRELVFEEIEPEVGEVYRNYTITKITIIW